MGVKEVIFPTDKSPWERSLKSSGCGEKVTVRSGKLPSEIHFEGDKLDAKA